MPAYDLQRLHPLLIAFDTFGRSVYGNEWRGDEVCARPAPDADECIARKRAIEHRLQALREEDLALRRTMEPGSTQTTQTERDWMSRKATEIFDERDKLRAELTDLPEITDFMVSDSRLFQRRLTVERHFKTAFNRGDLNLICGTGSIAQWKEWAKTGRLRVSFGLSTVLLPPESGHRSRRAPAFVERAAFNKWLIGFARWTPGDGTVDPIDQCIDWIRTEIGHGKQKSKGEYRSQAIQQISGLSARAFDRIWANEVPDTWKISGPVRESS